MHLNIPSAILLLIISTSVMVAKTHADNTNTLLRVPIHRASRLDPVISSIQQKTGLDKRDPFTASLYNDAGLQYLISVSIGTPAQNFSVTLDTGSADLWIPGSSCSKTVCPNGRFNQAASTTFKSLNNEFGVVYGIGSVNGTYVTDTVTIAGATVQTQQFGLASTTSEILTNLNTISAAVKASSDDESVGIKASVLSSSTTTSTTANGILGLGFPRLTAASGKGQGVYNPFVFNLVANQVISDPVFSIYLNSGSSVGWVGEIIFGGVDATKYTGEIAYLPVASLASTKTASNNKKRATLPSNDANYYWMVGAQGVAVTNANNALVNETFSSNSAFILDTGTTLTYLPTIIAQQVVEAFAGQDYSIDNGSGAYIVNCNAAKSTAVFEMKMAASATDDPIVLSVPASQLVIPMDADTAANANYCLFGIAPTSISSIGKNLYLVGDSVLRSAYMVYDMGQNRVGIAAASGVPGAVRGTSSPSASSANDSTYGSNNAIVVLVSCLLMAILAF